MTLETLGKWSIAYQQYVAPLLACQPALAYLYPFPVESSRIGTKVPLAFVRFETAFANGRPITNSFSKRGR